MKVSAPELLTAQHSVVNFCSGETVLDEWLARRALKNQETGASRTYVVIDVSAVDRRVVGYYALANGAILAQNAPGKIRRNMPNPIPVMVLGRLAIDQAWQGKGLGKALLRDALLRTLQAAEIAGIRALLVHALHERAATFYRNAGFVASPHDEQILMIALQNVRAILKES